MLFFKLKIFSAFFVAALMLLSCNTEDETKESCETSLKTEFETTETLLKEDLLLYLESMLLSTDELVRTASLLAETDEIEETNPTSEANPFFHLLGGLELKCVKEEREISGQDIKVSTNFSECEGLSGSIESNFNQKEKSFSLETQYSDYTDLDLKSKGKVNWTGKITGTGIEISSNEAITMDLERKCLPEDSCRPRWSSKRNLNNQLKWTIALNRSDKVITIDAKGKIKRDSVNYDLEIKKLRYDFLNCSKGADSGEIIYSTEDADNFSFSFKINSCRNSEINLKECKKELGKKETDQYFLLTLLDIRLIYNQMIGYLNLVKNYNELVSGNE